MVWLKPSGRGFRLLQPVLFAFPRGIFIKGSARFCDRSLT